ncbi:MAG: hypothetical protein CM15mV33_090 [uncultured marine virus]|nr:MAG: hypothetical protein CM15mV33_090 [uncultured marine virus]
MEGYATREAAEERARQIGCTGAHAMPNGMGFMPCSTHAAYERVTGTGGDNPKPSGGYAKAKDHQDGYKPTRGMVSAAKRGLELREAQSPSNRGGTAVGLARARDIVNGKNLSLSSVKRMYSFFSRHEVDKRLKALDQVRTATHRKACRPGCSGEGTRASLGVVKSLSMRREQKAKQTLSSVLLAESFCKT